MKTWKGAGLRSSREPELWEAAHQFGANAAGLCLGIPFCLTVLVLDVRGMFANTDPRVMSAMTGYFALVVIPAAAFVSSAMCACPPTEATTASRAMKAAGTVFGLWAFLLIFMAALELGVAWQYKSIVGTMPHRDVASLAVLGAAVPTLAAGCWAGFHLGVEARRDREKPLGRFLGRCWGWTRFSAERRQPENTKAE